jgi:hypothetical protein
MMITKKIENDVRVLKVRKLRPIANEFVGSTMVKQVGE